MAEPADALRLDVAQAQVLIDLGRHAEAVPLLQRAIARWPAGPTAYCLLALCFIELRQPKNAEAMARSAIGIAPEMEWPHRVRSLALRAMRKRRDALSEAQEAVRLAPNHAVVLAALGVMQLENRKFDEATRSAQAAVRLSPETVEGHALLADIAFARRRWREAEPLYRQALAIEPNNWALMNNFGVTLTHLGRKPEAMEIFEKAVRLDPRAGLPQQNLFRLARKLLVNRPLYVILGLLSLTVVISINTWLRAAWDANNPWLIGGLVLYIFGFLGVAYLSERSRKRRFSPTTHNFYTAEQRRIWRQRGLTGFFIGAFLIVVAVMAVTVVLDVGAVSLVVVPAVLAWIAAWAWSHRRVAPK